MDLGLALKVGKFSVSALFIGGMSALVGYFLQDMLAAEILKKAWILPLILFFGGIGAAALLYPPSF